MIMNNIIFINMFVLVFMDQFERFYKNPSNPLFVFKENINHFQITYAQYLAYKNKKKIHINKIVDFLKYLGLPLGFN